MKINNINYLLAEKRGCPFFNYDKDLPSDIGNYRLYICFTSADGQEVSGDVTLHRKTGEMAAQMCRYDGAANCTGFPYHWRNPRNMDTLGGYPYTIAGLLKYVNDRSVERYDAVKWVQSFSFDQAVGENFTPSSRIYQWAQREHLETWNDADGIKVKTYTGTWKYLAYRSRTFQGTRGPFERVTIFLEEANPAV